MSETEYGSDRRDDFFSVLDEHVDEEISPSTVFGNDIIYQDIVVSGWLVKPNANVGHHVHKKDRNISDIPYELAGIDDEPEELSGERGNVYLSGPLSDTVEYHGNWLGSEAIDSDEDIDADLYMVGNISGDICIEEAWESFHGADIVIAEFLLDRYDVLDEYLTEDVLEDFVSEAAEDYDTVFGVGEWSDDRVYVVAKDESEEPEPGEATAEMKFPPGTGSSEKAREDASEAESRQMKDEGRKEEKELLTV